MHRIALVIPMSEGGRIRRRRILHLSPANLRHNFLRSNGAAYFGPRCSANLRFLHPGPPHRSATSCIAARQSRWPAMIGRMRFESARPLMQVWLARPYPCANLVTASLRATWSNMLHCRAHKGCTETGIKAGEPTLAVLQTLGGAL